MKRIFTITCLLVFTIRVFAQVPDKLSYQAVIRDAGGILVTNKTIGMRVSILQGSETGTEVYMETYNPNPQTNANGLMTLEIGSGIPESGNFADINWANGSYFIKTETDPDGGTNYTLTAVTQLFSVPYSLHAKTADNITGIIPETDPYFDASVAKGITGADITNWNNKLDSYTETQNLGDVAALDNRVNTQLKNVTDPSDAQDAATKAYVDALKDVIYNELLDAGINAIVKDTEGNTYKTVKIGDQIWMAENLKYLPSVVSPDTDSQTTPYYYVYGYNDTVVADAKATANYTTYGVLYNWSAAMNGAASSTANPSGVQGVCPTGWHLPSDAEWKQLNDYLGGTLLAGGKLKETGTSHWSSPNAGATNESGFTALPGGYRHLNSFSYLGSYGLWWSATEANTYYVWAWYMFYDYSNLNKYNYTKEIGFSVRCVRD